MQMDHLPSHEVEAPIPIRSSFVVGAVGRGFGGGEGGGPSYPTNHHHHVVHQPAGGATVAATATGVTSAVPKEERPRDDSRSPPSPSPPPPLDQSTQTFLNGAKGPPSPPPTSGVVDVASHRGTHVAAGKAVAALESSSSYVYRECLRNHAASLGGNATDGCGEFMPGGVSVDADGGAASSGGDALMYCSACGCHRNFHRKELTGGSGGGHRYSITSYGQDGTYYHPTQQHVPYQLTGRKLVGQKGVLISTAAACTALIPYRHPPQQQHQPPPVAMAPLPLHAAPAPESDYEMDDQPLGSPAVPAGGAYPTNAPFTAPFVVGSMPPGYGKKRFRTKFTPEQKKRMLGFAERVGWRLQRREEAEVQRFCHEIGVKRRVLKVWMHNNKHNRRNLAYIGGIYPNIISSSSNGAGSGDRHHHDEDSDAVPHDARGHGNNDGRDLNHNGNSVAAAVSPQPASHPQTLQHHHQHPASSVIQVE